MHATVGQQSDGEGKALFFAELPDAAADQKLIRPMAVRSAYGAARKPNWPAILTIAAAHIALFAGLVRFDVIDIRKKEPPLTVIDISEIAPPPPVEERPAPKPTPAEIVPQIVTPPPVVATKAVTPPPLSIAPPPPKPAPVPAPPSGPVTVGNLDEKMIEGKPPRYPVESRRKKEQGTVLLRLLIGADGHVEQVSIAQSSGFERLDQAALQAARNWRWQPMIRDGNPVEVRGTMSIPFVLQG